MIYTNKAGKPPDIMSQNINAEGEGKIESLIKYSLSDSEFILFLYYYKLTQKGSSLPPLEQTLQELNLSSRTYLKTLSALMSYKLLKIKTEYINGSINHVKYILTVPY